MDYKTIFPFIRNNYFGGKQLTARDFQAEQAYGIDKLRALRYALCGAGVAAGLDVIAVDSEMLCVESGYAFDGIGRDIVVASPMLKSIRAIDGFDEIDPNPAVYLCIEYAEAPAAPVSPLSDSNKTEFGRISEGYRLFLTNRPPEDLSCGMRSIIETTKELFHCDKASVKMTVPKYVNVEEKLIIKIVVEKRCLNDSLSVKAEIKHEVFSSNGANTSSFSYCNATELFDEQTQSLTLTPVRTRLGVNTVTVPADKIEVMIGDEKMDISDDISFETQIIEEPVAARVRKEFFCADIESLAKNRVSERLYLAKISLSDFTGKIVIEKVKSMPFEQYILTERLAYLLNNLPVQPLPDSTSAAVSAPVTERREDTEELVSHGIESIDIDVDFKGKIYYSSEIVHGLGEGSISYSISAEPIDGTDSTLVFGDASLFEGSPYDMDFPKLQYGIISYNDKGTFRIAVKLLERIGAGNIKLHWQAVKAKEHRERDAIEIEKVSISIKPNLVNIEPRETVSLECVIEGCDNLNCIWNVEDKNGGTISRDGVYKAPSTEGVYTVTATSVKYPTKKAVNYIIVSKRREL